MSHLLMVLRAVCKVFVSVLLFYAAAVVKDAPLSFLLTHCDVSIAGRTVIT